jgi:hypothetical protein
MMIQDEIFPNVKVEYYLYIYPVIVHNLRLFQGQDKNLFTTKT